jgi:hypothetical protein
MGLIKSVFKLAALYETTAVAANVYYTKKKKKSPLPSVLLKLFTKKTTIATKAKVKAVAPKPANPLFEKITKPVGIIMWDGWYRDYHADNPLPYDKLINVASGNRAIASMVDGLSPFFADVNLPVENVPVYKITGYNPITGQNEYTTTYYPCTVKFDLNQQKFDQHLDMANDAGISFLCFNYYANDSPLSQGRLFYVSSQRKGNVKMCFMGPNLGFAPMIPQSIDYITTQMTQPYYFRIDGKPVIYLQPLQLQHLAAISASYASKSNGGQLYVVMFDNDMTSVGIPYDNNTFNYQAGGHYCSFGRNFITDHAHSGIVTEEVEKWNQFVNSRPYDIIPTMSAGFRNRNNYEPNNPHAGYTLAANPDQLRNQLNQFRQFLKVNTKAKAGLIYAGNEFAENQGGCFFDTKNNNGTINSTNRLLIKSFIK